MNLLGEGLFRRSYRKADEDGMLYGGVPADFLVSGLREGVLLSRGHVDVVQFIDDFLFECRRLVCNVVVEIIE